MGVGLLVALFFYDIFWVFGTDVMVTVAKNIDGPIKLLFPKDVIVTGPSDLSLLGLGDIVIPGIFVAMCLRFDFLRHWRANGKPRTEEGVKELIASTPKTYFNACQVGYLVAIVATVIVMLVTNHGQPALLYLVPGCCGSVMLTAFMRREFTALWGYQEQEELDAIEKEGKKLAAEAKDK